MYTSTNSHLILDVVGYVKPNADVSITKNDNVSAVIVGDTITYTVEAINNGPDTATDVSVSDVLPGDVTFASTKGCAEDPAGVPTCTLGDIAAGQSDSYTISATINLGASGTVTNTATASSSTGDPNLTNNSATEITGIDQVPPVITSNGGGATASKLQAENTTSVTNVQSSDNEGETENGGGLVYSLTTLAGGGDDNGLFTLNSATGALGFTTAPNFEAAADTDTDNIYEVQVTVTDSTALTDVQDISVTVTDVNEAPVIFSDDGGPTAALEVEENTTAVTDVQTADVDGDTEGAGLSYAKTTAAGGGVDNGLFTLNATTGLLRFTSTAELRAPARRRGRQRLRGAGHRHRQRWIDRRAEHHRLGDRRKRVPDDHQ